MLSIKKINSAFTLVELIVVIVILAILATITFLSFSSQSGSARDAVRLSDIANIRSGLELRQGMTGILPLPANPKTYTWWATATGVSGVTITEWTVNNSILSALSAWVKDPSWGEYKYSTISQWWQPLYYQLALELENPTSMRENVVNPFIAMSEIIASADDTTSKIVQLKWNYMFDPSLPSLFILSGSTSSASWWIYNPDVCFALDWSATNSFSNKDNCVAKKDMNLKEYDKSLVGYWDMETLTADWKLKDLSGNGNDGVFSGVTAPTKDLWLLWWSYFFWSWWTNNNSWFVQIANSEKFNDLPNWLTISTIVNKSICSPSSFIIIKAWKKVNLANYQTWSIENSNMIYYYNWWYYLFSANCTSDNIWFYAVNQIPDVKINMYNVAHYISENSAPDSNYIAINRPVLSDNKYHIVTSTMDWKWNIRKIYIDWRRLGEFTVPAEEQNFWIRKSSWDLFIWSNIPNLNWIYSKWAQYNWKIDDIKIYNRVLSDSEIYQQAKSIWF
ncbi:MAG: hypothetical protein ACD_3C00120G0004 [uncultured bacterium (gcode 4)]|uniref:Prepilin-type N-terminal cleavage/methylation domain-containing protein n=1 Tax=uncultured bacterium (gcode 4) TaxID=1234023 RepID=K2G170_9BACT|nr:MAG: hypothetical protein ACD_3C00120G0004 [uncultured bacterium (gcode 4)]